MKKLNSVLPLFLGLFLLLPLLAWGDNPGGQKSPTPLPFMPTPGKTVIVIAQDDPPSTPVPGVETAADHVGPAMYIVQAAPEKRLILEPGSLLFIKGTTTKQSYELGARVLLGSAILKVPVSADKDGSAILSAVKKEGIQAMTLVVPLESLKSADPRLDSNAFHSLKGTDNPYIQFRLEDETLTAGAQAGIYVLKANGKLTIAGVTRDIHLESETSSSEDQVRITGDYLVRLNDFNIKPLSAVWGVIHAKDAVDVHFDLLFGHDIPANH